MCRPYRCVATLAQAVGTYRLGLGQWCVRILAAQDPDYAANCGMSSLFLDGDQLLSRMARTQHPNAMGELFNSLAALIPERFTERLS